MEAHEGQFPGGMHENDELESPHVGEAGFFAVPPLVEELGHLLLHLFALQLLLQQELETCHRRPLRVLLIRLRGERRQRAAGKGPDPPRSPVPGVNSPRSSRSSSIRWV